MTNQQKALLPELLQNYICSSEMEGLTVSESLQAMCLSVLAGERTLADCLHQIESSHTAR